MKIYTYELLVVRRFCQLVHRFHTTKELNDKHISVLLVKLGITVDYSDGESVILVERDSLPFVDVE